MAVQQDVQGGLTRHAQATRSSSVLSAALAAIDGSIPKTAAAKPSRRSAQSPAVGVPAVTKVAGVHVPRRPSAAGAGRAWLQDVLGEGERSLSKLGHVLDDAAVEELKRVPALVSERYKEADALKARIKRVLGKLPRAMSGYGYVFWNPTEKAVWAVLGDSDSEQLAQRYSNAFKSLDGVKSVRVEAEYGPHGDDDWIMIKRGGATLASPLDWAGKLTGGASPLSNAIVGGLVAGGLGYGAGTAMESLFPDEYVERGKLRRTLGIMGALGGAVPGAAQFLANRANSAEAGKPMSLWQGLTTPNEQVPWNQAAADRQKMLMEGSPGPNDPVVLKQAMDQLAYALKGQPQPHEMFVRAAAGFAKLAAFEDQFGLDATGAGVRPVPVDAFNQAIWNDVHNYVRAGNNPYGTKSQWGDNRQQLHTPPAVGAAAAGLTAGIRSMYGDADVLTGDHFVQGVWQATKDLAKARIGGGILGALGGLTPAGQKQLQQMGIWGGFVRGAVKSILGV